MRTSTFLGFRFDRLTMDEALLLISTPLDQQRFRYMVTPNVDHVVRVDGSHDPEVIAAYRHADISLCDSQVLRLIAWPFGIKLSTIPGSDLVLKLVPGANSCGRSFSSGG